MFVRTEYLHDIGVLLATRRPTDARAAGDVGGAHVRRRARRGRPDLPRDRSACASSDATAPPEIRRNCARATTRAETTGDVLDPIFSLRQTLQVPARGSARLLIWTMVAETRDGVLDLVDRHQGPGAYDRVAMLAWTQNQVQLRHLGMSADEAGQFQALGGLVAYPRARPASGCVDAGPRPRRPVRAVVARCLGRPADRARPHRRPPGPQHRAPGRPGVRVLATDPAPGRSRRAERAIVVLRREPPRRPAGPRRSRAGGRAGGRSAGRHPPRAHRPGRPGCDPGARRRGQGDDRCPPRRARRSGPSGPGVGLGLGRCAAPRSRACRPRPHARAVRGRRGVVCTSTALGGFDVSNREYVVVLDGADSTPAPWTNVVANEDFGFHATAEGAGYTWWRNSRDNQLTPWRNDPVCSPLSEAIYVRNDANGALCSPTARPFAQGRHIVRHGFGATRYVHERPGSRPRPRPRAVRSPARLGEDLPAPAHQPGTLAGVVHGHVVRRARARPGPSRHRRPPRHRTRSRDGGALRTQPVEHAVRRSGGVRRPGRATDRVDRGPARVPRGHRDAWIGRTASCPVGRCPIASGPASIPGWRCSSRCRSGPMRASDVTILFGAAHDAEGARRLIRSSREQPPTRSSPRCAAIGSSSSAPSRCARPTRRSTS